MRVHLRKFQDGLMFKLCVESATDCGTQATKNTGMHQGGETQSDRQRRAQDRVQAKEVVEEVVLLSSPMHAPRPARVINLTTEQTKPRNTFTLGE